MMERFDSFNAAQRLNVPRSPAPSALEIGILHAAPYYWVIKTP